MDKTKVELAREADEFAWGFKEQEHMTISHWFLLAMARNVPGPVRMAHGPTLNLGAGYRKIGESISLDLERGWDAEKHNLPYADWSVTGIWAHGFFEHLTPEKAVATLWECQRVLALGGILNICVPHANSNLQKEDITHKSFWTEATLPNLFNNPYYDTGKRWELTIHTQFIMGVAWRNLALFIQLVKR